MQDEYDEYGNLIGTNTLPVYDENFTGIDICVSANKSQMSAEMFGNFTDYDRTMSISDVNCPINENSKLWIGISTEKPYNFIVTKMAVSLNETIYAIKQVVVND